MAFYLFGPSLLVAGARNVAVCATSACCGATVAAGG
jgi:hypothetical protein